MPFCSSLSSVLRDEQIELLTSTKVPGGFAWGQGVLYELGLGGGGVSGLSTKIRMIVDGNVIERDIVERPESVLVLPARLDAESAEANIPITTAL